jgi:hypothetical protein
MLFTFINLYVSVAIQSTHVEQPSVVSYPNEQFPAVGRGVEH